ncbi:uncharacterized protein CTRU02_200833 [Colletotrichum truncatum]|uniref:Uncharacterized protein n=1 Tax=Colletotrichum truncatum TaxID=5467 RepID=A0ACC3ZFN5_COLTU|nr:uncharacterized protein CTRU02_00599 [Colletotrichum truncatum]KAF6801850.1 hypothetical protein CTRU02_00599 [Colletotrichum truncatum]
MKLSAVLVALSLSWTAQACARYKYCHRYNADCTPNDDITMKACDGYPIIRDQGYTECNHYRFGIFGSSALDNCIFRSWCLYHGATGDDSSCRAKVRY